MKETIVALTDEQIERLAEEERRQGLAPDELIRRALDAYLGIANGAPSRARESAPVSPPPEVTSASQPWFVGLGRSGRRDIAENAEQVLAKEWGDRLVEAAGLAPRRPTRTADRDAPAGDQSDGEIG